MAAMAAAAMGLAAEPERAEGTARSQGGGCSCRCCRGRIWRHLVLTWRGASEPLLRLPMPSLRRVCACAFLRLQARGIVSAARSTASGM